MDTNRLPGYHRLSPELFRQLGSITQQLHAGSLGPVLVSLVEIRASQMNGCAYCLDMHAREFLAHDGDLQRLNSVATWREVPFFSERERAALQWTESLTAVGETHAPRDHFDALQAHFEPREIAELTLAIATINAWNRIGVGLRPPVAKKELAPAAH
jgi:AhpD family alkylhydroperoxidase